MKHADQGRFSRGIILLLCIGIFGYPSCLPRKEAESVNNASRDNALINSSISAETASLSPGVIYVSTTIYGGLTPKLRTVTKVGK